MKEKTIEEFFTLCLGLRLLADLVILSYYTVSQVAMLFLLIKIPKSVTQSSPLLKENQIDKNQINMFQLLLELSLLLHISFHLKNRLRLTEVVLDTDAKLVLKKLEDKLSFIDRSQAIESTKESTRVL